MLRWSKGGNVENRGEPIGVVLSVQPKWSELILSGKKTAELRKTFPRLYRLEPPFRCFIYETAGKTDTAWCDEDGHAIFRGRGAVVGEFSCRGADSVYATAQGITVIGGLPFDPQHPQAGLADYCLTESEAAHYLGGKMGSGWRIENATEYKTPLPVETLGLKRPPQSWGYVYKTQPFLNAGKTAGGGAARETLQPAT